MSSQLYRLVGLLQDRWGAFAFIGLTFWGLGWLELYRRRAGRPILTSAVLAVALIAVTAWGWMQQPIFLGQRWLALATLAGWAGLLWLCGFNVRIPPPENDRPLPVPRGPVVLRNPAWVIGVGCVTFLFCSGITLISNLVPNCTTTIVTTGFFAGFAVLGGLVAIAALFERYCVSLEGIAARSIVGATRFMAWKDVVRIAYNPQMQWLYLKDRRSRTVRLSVVLNGLPAFARLALEARPDAIDPELRAQFHTLAKEAAV